MSPAIPVPARLTRLLPTLAVEGWLGRFAVTNEKHDNPEKVGLVEAPFAIGLPPDSDVLVACTDALWGLLVCRFARSVRSLLRAVIALGAVAKRSSPPRQPW